jgi:hypothetical protein
MHPGSRRGRRGGRDSSGCAIDDRPSPARRPSAAWTDADHASGHAGAPGSRWSARPSSPGASPSAGIGPGEAVVAVERRIGADVRWPMWRIGPGGGCHPRSWECRCDRSATRRCAGAAGLEGQAYLGAGMRVGTRSGRGPRPGTGGRPCRRQSPGRGLAGGRPQRFNRAAAGPGGRPAPRGAGSRSTRRFRSADVSPARSMPRCGRSRPAVCSVPVDPCRDPLTGRPSRRHPAATGGPPPRTPLSGRPSARTPLRSTVSSRTLPTPSRRCARRCDNATGMAPGGMTTRLCTRRQRAGAEAVHGAPHSRHSQANIGKRRQMEA